MLEAVFTENVDEIKVSGLTQWDRGQWLQIVCPDLPANFQVHFTNRAREKAIPVSVSGADNITILTIPDEILREPFEVLAYIYFTDGYPSLVGETVKTIRMPITPRAQPEDYVVDLTQEQKTAAERMLGDYATAAADKATQGALSSIREALSNLPEGDTLVINDLTTGGTAAALSAEMGKVLASRKVRNLLDNSDFSNPVNQRGLLTYATASSTRHTIDRWRATRPVTVEVIKGVGIRLTNTEAGSYGFTQVFAEDKAVKPGATYTLACESVDGVIYASTVIVPESGSANGSYIDGEKNARMRIYAPTESRPSGNASIMFNTSGSVELKWFAVYEGGYTVDTLPPYQPKGYGAELAECQRYYQLFSSADKRPTNLADYRPNMRANPATGTITIDDVTYYFADSNLS